MTSPILRSGYALGSLELDSHAEDETGTTALLSTLALLARTVVYAILMLLSGHSLADRLPPLMVPSDRSQKQILQMATVYVQLPRRHREIACISLETIAVEF